MIDGIVMEKYQEVINGNKFYVINLTLELFKSLKFTVDLSGSVNIGVSPDDMVKEVIVPPFTKTEVARFTLNKHWKVKTKFKY